ncbi:hypothetical protein GCM10027345_33510 [Hymenobacter daeguensis]
MRLLLTAPAAAAQPVSPALVLLVQPRPGPRPLGEVLAELSRQSHLPFSYSSSLVPTGRRCVLRPGPPRPLAAVLREILEDEQLSFGLVGGQLVLWPSRLGVPTGVVAVNGRPEPTAPVAAVAAGAAGSARSSLAPASLAANAGPARAAKALANPAVAARRATGNGRSEVEKESIGSVPAKAAPTAQTTGRPAASRHRPAPAVALKAASGAAATAAVAATAADSRGRDAGKAALKAAAPNASGPQAAAGAPARQALIRPAKGPAGGLASEAAPGRAGASHGAAAAAVAGGPQVRNNSAARSPGRRISASGPSAPAAQAGKRAPAIPVGIDRPEADLLAPLAGRPIASGLQSSPPPVLPGNPGAAPASDTPPPAATASPPKQQTSLAALAGPKYLHGEAAIGETLVLSGVGKVGFQRAYLVLGAGIVGGGRQGGGGFGIGLGTAGQARGRFTPSLEVLGWFLGGGRESGADHSQLVQLRPALAWQLRQGSRWQLIGGPTFNLATARTEGNAADRWPLGHDQWLWLNSGDEHSSVRLWPGLQLGVRF